VYREAAAAVWLFGNEALKQIEKLEKGFHIRLNRIILISVRKIPEFSEVWK
jgi:hypothetical protein